MEATVNGLPADALVVDGIFIGVAVDAGNHIIELRYQPAWWWPAVIFAISALVIAMVMVVRQRVVVKRRLRAARSPNSSSPLHVM